MQALCEARGNKDNPTRTLPLRSLQCSREDRQVAMLWDTVYKENGGGGLGQICLAPKY